MSHEMAVRCEESIKELTEAQALFQSHVLSDIQKIIHEIK